MDLTSLFGTIHGSHCIILANFYLCLLYFRQKIFNFSKISKSHTYPKCVFGMMKFASLFYYLAYFCYYSWPYCTFLYYTIDKLNTNGSALSNRGIAGTGGILRDHSGQWISGFSLHLVLATNNMAEFS